MWAEVDKRIRRAAASVRQAFRGVVTNLNSNAPIQLAQGEGLSGEPLQDLELMQHYGFTSAPPDGTETVILPLGGKTSHGIIIATEHGSYRLKALQRGEVALYTDEGARIVLRRGRVIDVDCDEFKVNCKTWQVNAADKADFNTPALTASAELVAKGLLSGQGGMAIEGGDGASFTGDVRQAGGSYRTDGDVVAGGVSLRGHKHPGDSGGVTGMPI